MSINNEEDWWALCDKRWENILDIFNEIGIDMSRSEEARWWADEFGSPDVRHEKCLTQHLEDLKKAKKGVALHMLLNRAWGAAPDEGHIHTWKGWGDFCDLCSENWVFYPDQYPSAIGETHDDPVGSFGIPNQGAG